MGQKLAIRVQLKFLTKSKELLGFFCETASDISETTKRLPLFKEAAFLWSRNQWANRNVIPPSPNKNAAA